MLRYVSHPEVEIDPMVPVPEWGLSELGRRRATAMLRQPWIGAIGTIITSDEQKALDTAAIVAAHLGVDPDVRPDTHENRRAGYLPPAEFEATADAFFAQPETSVRGWERAIDAQTRVHDALRDVLASDQTSDVMVVGHGGVGTLLLCALAGWEIDRRHDQTGVGNHFAVDRATGAIVHGWRPIDLLETD